MTSTIALIERLKDPWQHTEELCFEAATALTTLEAERIVAPAECSNCDDPDCPYSHKPLTLREAYDNCLARLNAAATELTTLLERCEKAEAERDTVVKVYKIAEEQLAHAEAKAKHWEETAMRWGEAEHSANAEREEAVELVEKLRAALEEQETRTPKDLCYLAGVDRQVKLEDKVEGLEADLDSAVEIAFKYGALDWVRLNYPRHYERFRARAALGKGGE